VPQRELCESRFNFHRAAVRSPVVWRAGCGSKRSQLCQILQPLTSCCGSSLRWDSQGDRTHEQNGNFKEPLV